MSKPLVQLQSAIHSKSEFHSPEELHWDQPIPLPAICPEPQHLSLDDVPEGLRNWIDCISSRMGCPHDALLAVALAAAAVTVGSRVVCQPKRYDSGWHVALSCLWTMLVGSPATKKSPIIKAGLEKLQALEKQSRQEYESFEREHKPKREALLRKISKRKAQLTAPTLKASEEDKLESELDVLQKSLLLHEMKQHRRIVNDATVEKFEELLKDNTNGIGIVVDELSHWVRGLDKPGQEGSRGTYLSAHNGDQDRTVDRIGRGTIHIPKLWGLVIGGIQPERLTPLISGKTGNESDGLIQRFQLLIYLPRHRLSMGRDQVPNLSASDYAQAIFASLNKLEFLPSCSVEDPYKLAFDDHAQAAFNDWLRDHAIDVNNGGYSPPLEAFLCKSPSTIAALAAIIQLLETADLHVRGEGSMHDRPSIGLPAFIMARRILEVCKTHAQYVFSPTVNSDLQSAHALFNKIRSGEVLDGEAIRNIYRHEWPHLQNSEKTDAAINILEKHNFVRQLKASPSLKTRLLKINPYLQL